MLSTYMVNQKCVSALHRVNITKNLHCTAPAPHFIIALHFIIHCTALRASSFKHLCVSVASRGPAYSPLTGLWLCTDFTVLHCTVMISLYFTIFQASHCTDYTALYFSPVCSVTAASLPHTWPGNTAGLVIPPEVTRGLVIPPDIRATDNLPPDNFIQSRQIAKRNWKQTPGRTGSVCLFMENQDISCYL